MKQTSFLRDESLRRELIAYDAWVEEAELNNLYVERARRKFISSLPNLKNLLEIRRQDEPDLADATASDLAIADARSIVHGLRDRYALVDVIGRVLKTVLIIIVLAWAGQWVAGKYQDHYYAKHAQFESKIATINSSLDQSSELQYDATRLLGTILHYEFERKTVPTEYLRRIQDVEKQLTSIANRSATFTESTPIANYAAKMTEDLEEYRSCLDDRRIAGPADAETKPCQQLHITTEDYATLPNLHNEALREVYSTTSRQAL